MLMLDVGGERDALIALADQRVSAACLIASNYTKFASHDHIVSIAGSGGAAPFRVIGTTGPFDHCNMSILTPSPRAELLTKFREMLMAMRKEDPTVVR